MNWVAYCLARAEELENCPNGTLVEKAAELHNEDTGHQVIVGYYIEEDESDDEPD